MPDGSMLLMARYCTVPSGFIKRSWFSSQSVVFGSSLTAPAVVSGGIGGASDAHAGGAPLYAVMSASWNLQSAVANASAFIEFVPVVLRWISSENELPSSWVRRFR